MKKDNKKHMPCWARPYKFYVIGIKDGKPYLIGKRK